jgi:hypothetical protein
MMRVFGTSANPTKRRFSGVTRSRRQDHDFFRAAVLFGGSRHQVRQDRKGHVFEGDGRGPWNNSR